MAITKENALVSGQGVEGAEQKSLDRIGQKDTSTSECNQLAELFDEPRWVPYALKQNPETGKLDKVPHTGKHGLSTKKSADWMPYTEAAAIAERPDLNGVGLVMTGGIDSGEWRLVGLDFDDVNFDKFTMPWPTYAERSPSGTGIRAFLFVPLAFAAKYRDTMNAKPDDCAHAEVYFGTTPRFLTVTFDVIDDHPIARINDPADLKRLEAWGLNKFEVERPLFLPERMGEVLNLADFDLKDGHLRVATGQCMPEDNKSDLAHGLLIALFNQGILPDRPDASVDDVFATLVTLPGLQKYLLSHRHDDGTRALQFAVDEVGRAYARSIPGMLENLASFAKPKADTAANDDKPASLLVARPLSLHSLATPVQPWVSVLGRFLPLSVVTELNGAHGIGKSSCALHMCCCVATGQDYMGLPGGADPGRAVFCSKEDPYNVVLMRIQEWVRSFPEAERDNLNALLVQNLLVYGSDETEALMLTATDGKSCTMRLDAIEECAERWHGARLVVLETAGMLHAGDQMNEHLQVLVNVLKRIASRLEAAVVMIRHISKTAAREGTEDSLVGTGGASFSDSARSVILIRELTAKEAGDQGIDVHKLGAGVDDCALLRVVNTKNNYLPKEKAFYILRMGSRFIHVEPRGEQKVSDERLLLFMQKQLALGNAQFSFSVLKGRCKEVGITQAAIDGALGRLTEAEKLVRVVVTKGGTHPEWRLKT